MGEELRECTCGKLSEEKAMFLTDGGDVLCQDCWNKFRAKNTEDAKDIALPQDPFRVALSNLYDYFLLRIRSDGMESDSAALKYLTILEWMRIDTEFTQDQLAGKMARESRLGGE